MRSDLKGKVAFVTGAAGGIGRGIVSRLAANGASIVVADINGEGARDVAASLPDALAVTVDIRDPVSVDRAVALTMETYGRLDILVNNAGVNTLAHRVDVDAFPVEEWHRIVGIDLDGLFLMSRRALEPMLAAGEGGRVINIASVVGLAAMRLQSPFVAAKAGIIHLTRSMALELGAKGVLVNAIAPGSIMTEATKALFYGAEGKFQAKTQAFMEHIPLGRPGTPEEIAEAVLFLAAPESSYINGQILAVDGGWTAGYMM
ncbi:beta-ketoacyl-ACP reductase [Kaistia sp. 32K]|uniref:SDR family NAD(P)-dependent oxidoreductase n=1 Tax=Kaistia sp. 32K TaxID=2795690 RepID=UPI0019161407|nr:glucose 1-dehydrogenase [Kaistia sp. 32K]BCP51954.1 beta-ketoacyl-ACP reductase [Kaistia sp. 32K]